MRPTTTPLCERLRTLAGEWTRYGYRRLHVLLRREGWVVNHKRILRLYQAEHLAVRRRRRKRVAGLRAPIAEPTRATERWSMDFVTDALGAGRSFRVLSIVDDRTRECLALEPDTSLPGSRVVQILSELVAERGRPTVIVSDNGPEFTGRALDQWAYQRGVRLHFIEPGKYPECVRGDFPGEAAGRVPQWALVPESRRCAADVSRVADDLQSGATAQCARVRLPRGVCWRRAQTSGTIGSSGGSFTMTRGGG